MLIALLVRPAGSDPRGSTTSRPGSRLARALHCWSPVLRSPDGLRSQPRSRSSPEPPMAAVAPCSHPQSLPPPMRIGPDWPPGQILSLGTPKCTSQTKLRLFIEFCVSASVRRCKALDHLIKVGFGLLLVQPQNGVKITAGTLDTQFIFISFLISVSRPTLNIDVER